MHHLPIDKDLNKNDSVLMAPAGFLHDEQQWLYLKERYCMTPRELQAARLVCKGFNNSEIAKILNIKYGTVKVHLRNIYRKVRVGSKISLLLKFVEDVNGFYAMSESVSHLPVPITESVPQASSDILYESPIKNEV